MISFIPHNGRNGRRCHPNFSGYEGPWTPTPTIFAGAIYFKLLKSIPWSERKVPFAPASRCVAKDGTSEPWRSCVAIAYFTPCSQVFAVVVATGFARAVGPRFHSLAALCRAGSRRVLVYVVQPASFVLLCANLSLGTVYLPYPPTFVL